MRDLQLFVAFALLVSAGLGSGCSRGAESQARSVEPVGADHRFTIDVGGRPVQMRLAVLEHERSRGLMHVPSMPEDEGMLFIFAEPRRMSFYMRNTRIPLDIGYFDAAGVLQEIYPMHPFIEDSVPSMSDRIQLALEMNQGWYARQGVRTGAGIDLAAVREALRRRGFDPKTYLP